MKTEYIPTDIIGPEEIAWAIANRACQKAVDWLKESPRTAGEAVAKYGCWRGFRFTGETTHDRGDRCWYRRGKLHREDGPAVEHADGTKEWYVSGKRQAMSDGMPYASH